MNNHLNSVANMMNNAFSALFEIVDSGRSLPEVKQVIFNPPATIVCWSDGVQTVAVCNEQDVFSEEVGLAMACAKRLLHPYEKFQECLKKAIRVQKPSAPKKVQPKRRVKGTFKPVGTVACTKQIMSMEDLLRAFADGEDGDVTIVLKRMQ